MINGSLSQAFPCTLLSCKSCLAAATPSLPTGIPHAPPSVINQQPVACQAWYRFHLKLQYASCLLSIQCMQSSVNGKLTSWRLPGADGLVQSGQRIVMPLCLRRHMHPPCNLFSSQPDCCYPCIVQSLDAKGPQSLSHKACDGRRAANEPMACSEAAISPQYSIQNALECCCIPAIRRD